MVDRTVVILGATTAGIVAARRLPRTLDPADRVVVVDRNPTFRFAPSYLWVMTGTRRPEQISADRRSLRRAGFRSVEADVRLVDGELCIGHDGPDCSRTLQSLYLRPLAEIARANGGEIHDDSSEPLRLHVDVKDGGQAVWDVLADQLEDRPQLVTSWVADREITRAVEVVVSGQPANRTFDDRVRWAAGDGRIATPPPADATSEDLVVLSENWTRLFTWQGVGPMPESERHRLHDLVDEAHAEGYEVRFWATLDTEPGAREAVWRELVDSGVDQINTDHLRALEEFLKSYDPTEQTS